MTYFRDIQRWHQFVTDVDQYVPEDWTRLGDIVHNSNGCAMTLKSRDGNMTAPQTRWNGNVTPLQRKADRLVNNDISVLRPTDHHLDYFADQYRGLDKKRQPVTDGHPWHGLRNRMVSNFRKHAVAQLQAMGGLDPARDFRYEQPDRNQSIGFDGTVCPMSKRRRSTACKTHTVGGDSKAKVYGSKFTIASGRINGQYHSRVILDLAHTGTDPLSDDQSENAAVRRVTPIVKRLASKNGRTGLKTIVVDSIVRGQDVTAVQRSGTIVVNYPHAQSNPDGGPGKRLNPTRVEKNHLRTIAEHPDEHGDPCRHLIYAIGGELAVLVTDSHGQPASPP